MDGLGIKKSKIPCERVGDIFVTEEDNFVKMVHAGSNECKSLAENLKDVFLQCFKKCSESRSWRKYYMYGPKIRSHMENIPCVRIGDFYVAEDKRNVDNNIEFGIKMVHAITHECKFAKDKNVFLFEKSNRKSIWQTGVRVSKYSYKIGV
eukprot:Pgem_evm1s16373